jgi:hypothetical protein
MSNKYAKNRSQLMRPKVCRSLPVSTFIEEPPPNPWDDVLTEGGDEVGRCNCLVKVFYAIPVVLFFNGVQSECGKFGSDLPTHTLFLRFNCRSTGFAVRDAVNNMHAARQAAQDYCLGTGPWPLNATIENFLAQVCICAEPPGSLPWKQTVSIQNSPPGYEHYTGQALYEYLGL